MALSGRDKPSQDSARDYCYISMIGKLSTLLISVLILFIALEVRLLMQARRFIGKTSVLQAQQLKLKPRYLHHRTSHAAKANVSDDVLLNITNIIQYQYECVYIYIQREREIDRYTHLQSYVYIYIYIYMCSHICIHAYMYTNNI